MKNLILILLFIFIFRNFINASQVIITNAKPFEIKGGQENSQEVEKYLKEHNDEMEKIKNQEEPESKLRRAEVMFFSSGAIVYFSSFLFAKLYAGISKGFTSTLPNPYWAYIGANSIGIATYVTIKDSIEYSKYLEEEKAKDEKLKQTSYKIDLLNKRF